MTSCCVVSRCVELVHTTQVTLPSQSPQKDLVTRNLSIRIHLRLLIALLLPHIFSGFHAATSLATMLIHIHNAHRNRRRITSPSPSTKQNRTKEENEQDNLPQASLLQFQQQLLQRINATVPQDIADFDRHGRAELALGVVVHGDDGPV